MRTNQARGCAVALALTASSAGLAEGFHGASVFTSTTVRLLASAECGRLSRPAHRAQGTAGASAPHTLNCTHERCARSLREALGGRARRRGHAIAGVVEDGEGAGAGGTAAAMAGLGLDDKTVDVGSFVTRGT